MEKFKKIFNSWRTLCEFRSIWSYHWKPILKSCPCPFNWVIFQLYFKYIEMNPPNSHGALTINFFPGQKMTGFLSFCFCFLFNILCTACTTLKRSLTDSDCEQSTLFSGPGFSRPDNLQEYLVWYVCESTKNVKIAFKKRRHVVIRKKIGSGESLTKD